MVFLEVKTKSMRTIKHQACHTAKHSVCVNCYYYFSVPVLSSSYQPAFSFNPSPSVHAGNIHILTLKKIGPLLCLFFA